MSSQDTHPLLAAQKLFAAAVPRRGLAAEEVSLWQALGRVLFADVVAPRDVPPYARAIVEGHLVHCADTQQASEQTPVHFRVVGGIAPGDAQVPPFGALEALSVVTGCVVPEGDYAIVRPWDGTLEGGQVTIQRPFPLRFFIEEQGYDIRAGTRMLPAGHVITAKDIGDLASLGFATVQVTRPPRVAIFSCGNEVIPHHETFRVGAIFDSNGPMLAAAVSAAGGLPTFMGILRDDFDACEKALKSALQNHDMVVISGGTASGGRDFIADLVRATGELLIDGIKMKSGRPLIMGMQGIKPLVCVAGHPPEALRGFQLFGELAINRLLGGDFPLPCDPVLVVQKG
ncbi:MAG: molybdopterin molybdotransferase MoeA [Gammaproteobacteria bacterium]|nr:molybdopterin molybdotransferase MoeA [Gammaproteobacteria bacterium]